MEEQGSRTQLERVLAALAHGSIGIVGALCIWLAMKGKSAYVRSQALQAVVYQIAVVVVTVVGSILWIVLHFMAWPDFVGGQGPDWADVTLYAFPVGLPVLAILYALWGAVRCLDGHDFRYAIVGKLADRLAVLLPHPVQARDRKPLRPRLVVGIALLSLLAICLGWGILAEPVNAPHMLIQHWLGRDDFSGVHLEGADLSGAALSEADLAGAYLGGANLSGADLTHAFMARVGLSRADLSKATVSGASLGYANLHNADLSGADLSGASLAWANLSGADLGSADLTGASLYEAELIGANLTGADLTDAGLIGADLRWANLTNAIATDRQLNEALSLAGTTMPDGTVHE